MDDMVVTLCGRESVAGEYTNTEEEEEVSSARRRARADPSLCDARDEVTMVRCGRVRVRVCAVCVCVCV
jgi:hypothetical protein